jgi:15-cis-phytoene desaturase
LNAEVLVAGGGVAGLRCAVALADAGLRVLLVERDGQLGGRAGSVRDATTGTRIDLGPHVVTSEHRNFLAWIARLGHADDIRWQPEPLITLLDAGRCLRMPTSRLPPPLHALPVLPHALQALSVADLLSNWRVAWRALRLDEAGTLALDDIGAEQWLRAQGVSSASLQWFWTTACLALLNLPLADCSAAALMRVFRLLAGRSGYCFGFPRIALADLFADASRRAIEAAGGAVRTGVAVQRLLLRDGRFTHAECTDGTHITAGAAVVALDPPALARLAAPGWDGPADAPALARHFLPCPYVSTYLWLDRRVTTEGFWARVWAPGQLNLDFYDLANIRGAAADTPSLIASNAIHAHSAQSLDDDTLVRLTLRELAPLSADAAAARVRHAAVHRVPMAIACPLPGVERRRPPVETGIANLWLAGDWTATHLPSSMESAARAGALAAERAAAWLGRELKVAEPLPETVGLPGWLRRHWPWRPAAPQP